MSRLKTIAAGARELGMPAHTLRGWIKRGIVPGPVKGTHYLDMKAVHAELDKKSQLVQAEPLTELQKWQRDDASQAKAHL